MEYERLTKRNEQGNAVKVKNSRETYVCTILEEEAKFDAEILNRLAELEDKIENRTLIELPCKVGDTIYWLTSNNEIVEAVVSRIRINKYGVVFDVFEGGCEYSMFNTEFFKTKAEAEQKLKELENERD